MGNYLIGVDIGTQGTKTSLFDTDGNVIAEGFEASHLICPSPGIVEQDTDELYFSVLRTIKEVMEKSGADPRKVSAIGTDGQMAGIMGIDEEWNSVTCYDSWLDRRCGKYIDIIRQNAEETVIRITGCPVTYAHGSKVLWWKYERPEIYKRIAKFVMPTTYVVGRMAGLKASQAYIDYTHLHFSGFGDVLKLEWSDELLGLFKVDKEKMPEIVEPWKIVGRLTKEAAEECGLVEGIPIVAGCGDQAATSLGAGVTQKGIAFDVAGTASVFSCCVDTYNADVKNKTLLFPRSVIPGLWLPLAYIGGGGLCIKWFRDQLTGKKDIAEYTELDNEAAAVPPGSEGLIFIPHFGGRACPNVPDVRGSWLGLNWVHTRGHMYRAVMEGIAYEYACYLNILRELLGEVAFSNVLAVGGGAKSNLFNSIKSDVLGISYTPLKRGDTATFGSAITAGYGVGIYKEFSTPANRQIGYGDTLRPNALNHEKYNEYTGIYDGVFSAIGNIFRRLDQAGGLL